MNAQLNSVELISGLTLNGQTSIATATEPVREAILKRLADHGVTQDAIEDLERQLTAHIKAMSAAGNSLVGWQRDTPLHKAVYAINKTIFIHALKDLGVAEARYEYQGEGDSGGVEDFTLLDAEGDAQEFDGRAVYQLVLETGYVFENRPENSQPAAVRVTEQDLETALEDFLDNAISIAGHAGYENNDGGRGVVTFFVEDGCTEDGEDMPAGSVYVDHYDYYTESRRTESTL